MVNRLLIVDGSNLLFQMFYGMPARIVNSQGKPIHGTLGFIGALLKIIRRIEPTHLAVLFDGEHENVRAAIQPDYKANRTDYSKMPEEETPFSQLPDIYAALDYLNIQHMETTTCEVDDWIAGYVYTCEAGTEMIISSFDSDFFRLITERVSVLRYRGEKTILCTPAYIREKYGVEPEQFADYKALVGDDSDNIKGADKVGPKTAAVLLREYGTLEHILENAESIQRPSIRESIQRNAERLRTNYSLIKLHNSAELPFTLSEFAYEDHGITTNEVLQAIGVK